MEKKNKTLNSSVKCNCDKNCNCGCQESKECTCNTSCQCKCNCCCKNKKYLLKFIAIVIIFLAGMGFNELLHCMHCPSKNIRHFAEMKHNFPKHKPLHSFSDDRGNNIIIINTDGSHRPEHFFKHPKDLTQKNHHKEKQKTKEQNMHQAE